MSESFAKPQTADYNRKMYWIFLDCGFKKTAVIL